MSQEKDRAKKPHYDIDNRGGFDFASRSRSASAKHAAGTDNGKKRISPALIIAAVVLAVCLIVLGWYFYTVYEAKQNNREISDIFNNTPQYRVIHAADEDAPDSTAETSAPDGDGSDDSTVTEIVREPLIVTPSAQELLNINPDTVGYVRVPGIIEEVVVQGDDDKYYLTHNFYNETRQCGTCFADYRNNVNDYPDMQSDNIVLYAHNQADGSMFGNMDYYRWNYNYWQENPFIYFSNNYEESTYVIISSFVTNALPEHDDGNVFDYWNYIDFNDTYSYDTFISEITKRSTIITGVDVQPTDKFLTLSTCSTEWDESRHAIIARRLRDGETVDDFDTSKLQINQNPKWPAIYYKYHGGSYTE